MTVRQIAYRLKSEGKAEVLRDQQEVASGFQRTYAAAEAGATSASAATERQERRFRALAQAARDSEQASRAQAGYNSVLGVGAGSAGSARDSADVFIAQAEAMEDGEKRARALRSILDPLGVAQDRLNDELREYDALASKGAITTQELGRAQALARARFDETSASIDRQQRGMTRLVLSSRLNLARQGADVAVTAAMGMNPAMIAIQQGPQILDAMATSGIRVSGVMMGTAAAVGALATATGVLIAAWHSGEAGSLALERAVTGQGRTAQMTAEQLRESAEIGAEAGEVSVRSAARQAAAYVSTGKIGGEMISGLIAIHRDYASVMGLEAEDATQSLAKAMVEPDKAARDLTRSIGLLDQKTLDHIETLVEQGDRLVAQKILLEALTGAVDGHADKVGQIESLWDAAARGVSNYWDKLGRALYSTPGEELERLDRDIIREQQIRQRRERDGDFFSPTRLRALEGRRSALLLDGSEARREAAQAAKNQAAQEATDRSEAGRAARERAARKAEADAERRQRAAEREAREALQRSRREEDRGSSRDLEIARLRDDPARVQRLQDEASIRTRIRELEDDGLQTAAARNKAEAEHAELWAARFDAAQREATARAESLELQEALQRGDLASAQSMQDQADRQEALNANLQIWKNDWLANLVTDLEMAAAAERRADAIQRSVNLAREERDLNLARLSGRESEVRRLETDARIERRAREIEEREHLDRGQGKDRARTEIREELDAETEGVRRTWVKSFVADIRRGDIRSALSEQFEKATDRLLDKLIDGLFEIDWAAIFNREGGGGAGGLGGMISGGLDWLIGRNANGTDYWRGGPTWVGERGPELINAPRGSQIFDHGRSMRMLAAGVNGSGQVVHNHFSGNLLTPEFWATIQKGDATAARVGAQQGASTAIGVVHKTAPAVQRSERMLQG